MVPELSLEQLLPTTHHAANKLALTRLAPVGLSTVGLSLAEWDYGLSQLPLHSLLQSVLVVHPASLKLALVGLSTVGGSLAERDLGIPRLSLKPLLKLSLAAHPFASWSSSENFD